MIRRLDAPTERAASTNSFSRSERNSPRTMRASEVQVTRASNTARPMTPEPPVCRLITAAMASSGMVIITSVNRIRIDSVRPRK